MTRNLSTEIVFVCYHYLTRTDEFSRIWGHSFDLFQKHISYLLQEYQPVSLSELRAFLQGESELPPKVFMVTFDDSLAEHARIIAPYLERMKISGLFNISPSVFNNQPLIPQVVHFGTAYFGVRKFGELVRARCVETGIASVDDFTFLTEEKDVLAIHSALKKLLKYSLTAEQEKKILLDIWHNNLVRKVPDIHSRVYLSDNELQGMVKQGHEVGLHSSTHALINDDTFSDELFLAEIAEPKKELESIIEQEVTAFAYPYAYPDDVLYQPAHIQKLRDLGLDMLFTIFNKDNHFDRNYIGRYSSYSSDSVDDLRLKLWSYEISHNN